MLFQYLSQHYVLKKNHTTFQFQFISAFPSKNCLSSSSHPATPWTCVQFLLCYETQIILGSWLSQDMSFWFAELGTSFLFSVKTQFIWMGL